MMNASILPTKKNVQQGFTLIELLVVVAIIGVLMALGVSNYLSYKTNAVNSAAHATATDFLTLILADTAANGVDEDGPQAEQGRPGAPTEEAEIARHEDAPDTDHEGGTDNAIGAEQVV
jgi:prepilin-type N-terminal cleavage/methylation domain-containing protein